LGQVLGLSSHGTFHQILNGERNLPKKYLLAIGKDLNLSDQEVLYFETFIDLNKSNIAINDLPTLYAIFCIF
jgi:hypothetical protein